MTDQSAIRKISYTPPGPVAAAFMNSEAFVRGIMGPFGSGKSTTCIMEIMRRARLQAMGSDGKRHTRFAVIRNTYPELRTTTIKSWHQWFPPEVGNWVDSKGPPTHIIEQGDMVLEVLFVALDRPDDVAKLLSMELTGAWINEAREIPKGVLDGLTGRVGRFPSRAMGGCTWSGIIMDTNPPDNDHWWYVIAERDTGSDYNSRLVASIESTEKEMRESGLLPEGAKLFEFFKQPSGRGKNAENIRNLDPAYYVRQKAGKSEEWVKVYIDGEYGFTIDGKPIYPDYRDLFHCKEVEYDPALGLHIGIDFGRTPAAVIGQRSAFGNWRILSELVTEDMGAKKFARELRVHLAEHYLGVKISTITGDPAGEAASQNDEENVYDVLMVEGIFAKPAYTNDPIIRRDAVAESLRRMIEGVPGMLIHPRCRVLRKALSGGYCLKRINVAGDARYKDVPDKNRFSHVADAQQYLYLGAGEGKALTVRPENMNIRQTSFENGYGLT